MNEPAGSGRFPYVGSNHQQVSIPVLVNEPAGLPALDDVERNIAKVSIPVLVNEPAGFPLDWETTDREWRLNSCSGE